MARHAPAPHALLFGILSLILVLALAPRAQAQTPVAPAAPDSVTVPDATPGYVPLSGVAAITAGHSYTCALTTAGGLKCWGDNSHGELGDGTTTMRLTPVNVAGLTSGIKSVSAGNSHTCAVTTAGALKCWGNNNFGQLGNNSTTNSLLPVNVVGLGSGVAAVSAGSTHTCALTTTGAVKCWGHNDRGQLGNNSTTNSLVPVAVVGMADGVAAVDGGVWYTCAVAARYGTVKCWGANAVGQLGNNSTTDSLVPVAVSGLAGATAISAGFEHTCALTGAGGVKCWGTNFAGQLGDTSIIQRLTPVDVFRLTTGARAVSAEGYFTCALGTAGGAICWGDNGNGELGNGSTTSVSSPHPVSSLTSGVAAIDAGRTHACAVTIAGTVKCWGSNSSGQLGDNTRFSRSVPGDVLVPATCYRLTRTKSGADGSTPIAFPPQTDGCPLDHFVAGAAIQLSAAPRPGNKVRAWQNVPGGTPGVNVALYSMPAADSAINVLYGVCHALTLTFIGGSPVRASPANSLGCGSVRYGVSDSITLVASPTATQRVKTWTGAAASPGTGMDVNTLVMPDADKMVSVVYEACLALSVSVSGAGEQPIVYPAQSQGCASASTYAAGETVTLVARPAPGNLVAGWSGTDGADPFAAAQLTMPEGGASVAVTYAPAAHTIWLPAVASAE